MSWKKIMKYGQEYIPQGASDEETRLQMEFQDDDEKESAIINLQEDMDNVIRELEEMREGDSFETFSDRVGNMKTAEIKKLSDALGQVSVLLQ